MKTLYSIFSKWTIWRDQIECLTQNLLSHDNEAEVLTRSLSTSGFGSVQVMRHKEERLATVAFIAFYYMWYFIFEGKNE